VKEATVANRAQRRANGKAARRTGEAIPEASRSATDQALFNRQADRVAEGQIEWTPGRVTAADESVPSPVTNPQLKRRRTWRDWLRLSSWILIVVSAVVFLVVMWIPNLPLWAIITVSAAFALGVLSLFLVRGGNTDNPYLDANGTAI